MTNRTCKRCGLKQDIDSMHYSKQIRGYLCNDRTQCTKKLWENFYCKDD